jgi:uncharacterized protein (DUF1501 family)
MSSFFHPTRRDFLLTAGAFVAWSGVPRLASAARQRDPRFLTVILRGGMDGLSVVEPSFDPDFEKIRAGLVLGANGSAPGHDLGNGYILNPMLPRFLDMYRKGEALVVHAVASPYRERSHFDGQDVLESGLPSTGDYKSGWLNRAMTQVASAGQVKGGVVIAPTIPLLMRGPAATLSWSSGVTQEMPQDARARLLSLYKATDPFLADSFARGLALDKIAGNRSGEDSGNKQSGFSEGMQMVARLFTDANGPRIGSIDLDGWDTHSDEQPTGGNLGAVLAEFDEGLGTLRDGLGDAWKDTVVVIATEFGRTASMNGTEGTDHGTGTVAFMVGGAVRGGRVIADWPGLSKAALLDERDLMPTTDLRSIFKGALRDHLGLDEKALGDMVFPQSLSVKPMDKLLV